MLRRLIDNEGALDLSAAAETEVVELPASLPRDWVALYEAAFGPERELLIALAEAGAPRPEIGFESAGGVPISIAWPDRLIAADVGFEPEDLGDLKAEGWRVLPPERLAKALAG